MSIGEVTQERRYDAKKYGVRIAITKDIPIIQTVISYRSHGETGRHEGVGADGKEG